MSQKEKDRESKKKQDKQNKQIIKAAKTANVNVAAAINARKAPAKSLLLDWARALARPFEVPLGCQCPVTFNPVPSLSSTTARTTSTNLNLSLLANATTQIVLMPGHGDTYPSAQQFTAGDAAYMPLDGVAFHHRQRFSVQGGNMVVGPCATYDSVNGGPIGPTNGFVMSNMTLSSCQNITSTAVGMGYDTPLPYSVTQYGGSAHLRWQLVAMGIRIWNQTPELNRAGNAVSVQFMNQGGLVDATGSSATLQSQLEFNPSFRVHGTAELDAGLEVCWMPRLEDLAYWHTINGATGVSNTFNNQDRFTRAALAIFLNNPSSNAQTYAYQVVYHWQIAGNLVQSISEPAVNEPILRAPVEQTVTHLQNTASTASPAPIVAAAATTRADDNEGLLARLKRSAYDASMDMAHSIGKGFAEHVEQQVHRVLAPGGPAPPRVRASPAMKMLKY